MKVGSLWKTYIKSAASLLSWACNMFLECLDLSKRVLEVFIGQKAKNQKLEVWNKSVTSANTTISSLITRQRDHPQSLRTSTLQLFELRKLAALLSEVLLIEYVIWIKKAQQHVSKFPLGKLDFHTVRFYVRLLSFFTTSPKKF